MTSQRFEGEKAHEHEKETRQRRIWTKDPDLGKIFSEYVVLPAISVKVSVVLHRNTGTGTVVLTNTGINLEACTMPKRPIQSCDT